jgi:transposase-like protein
MARIWDETMAIDFKGSHFERDIILWGVRWYVAIRSATASLRR